MANPVVHFEIMSRQPDGLKQFYSDVFGWSFRRAAPEGCKDDVDYSLLDRNGEGGIGGGIGSAPQGYDGHVTFYVGVDKIEDALADIGKHGGSTMMGPQEVPGGPRIALFRDPGNHVIGLVQIDPACSQ